MENQVFINRAINAFKDAFPQARVVECKVLGGISLAFGIQNPELWTNNISHNDPCRNTIWLDFNGDNVTVQVEATRILCRPTDPYLAYGSIKVRKQTFTLPKEKAVEKLAVYFKNLRKTVDDNADNIPFQLEIV
jgi:hypothetical protein